MATTKIMSGARAKVGIHDRRTGVTKIIGIFNSVTWNNTYQVDPAYILGNYGPVELDYVAMEPVQLVCNGYRSVGNGPHTAALLPRLQDLLLHEYIEMAILDRQLEAQGAADARVGTARGVRPTGATGGYTARQLAEMTCTYVGLFYDNNDEGGENHEDPTAAQLP